MGNICTPRAAHVTFLLCSWIDCQFTFGDNSKCWLWHLNLFMQPNYLRHCLFLITSSCPLRSSRRSMLWTLLPFCQIITFGGSQETGLFCHGNCPMEHHSPLNETGQEILSKVLRWTPKPGDRTSYQRGHSLCQRSVKLQHYQWTIVIFWYIKVKPKWNQLSYQ